MQAKKLSPNALVALLLGGWWLLNVLLASSTELANDEAYYWWWAVGSGLDWGYYDHPPMVALLIWLTSWIPGELGVRLLATLLQPVGLYLFWRLWASKREVSARHALIFAGICFAAPLLQLYGVLALPDAPLMFASILFFVAIDRLWSHRSVMNAVWVGVATAFIGYSKYQGVLLVASAAVAYLFMAPKGERARHLAMIGCWAAVAAILYLPHLAWLSSHGWAPFQYHLSGRMQDPWSWKFTAEYLLGVLLVFNPFWLVVAALSARKKWKELSFMSVLMRVVLEVYVFFFFLASFRGRTQPQWNLVAVFSVVWIAMEVFESGRLRKYANIVCCIFAGLVLLARVLVIFNPLGWNGEVWHNKDHYGLVAAKSEGRPVLFLRDYSAPCKYMFYTGREACSGSVYYDRKSQWQYCEADAAWKDKEVFAVLLEWMDGDLDTLADGSALRYKIIPRYLPVQHIACRPAALHMDGFRLCAELVVDNPYGFAIDSNEHHIKPVLVVRRSQRDQKCLASSAPINLARGSNVVHCCWEGVDPAEVAEFPIAIGIEANGIAPSLAFGPKHINGKLL